MEPVDAAHVQTGTRLNEAPMAMMGKHPVMNAAGFTHFLPGHIQVGWPGTGPSVGVGAAQGPPLGGVLVIIIPDARPSAQAVANVLEGPGADREAAACGVGHIAGLPALVRRRVGATRHEAAPQQGIRLAKARCRCLDRKDIGRVGRQTRNR